MRNLTLSILAFTTCAVSAATSFTASFSNFDTTSSSTIATSTLILDNGSQIAIGSGSVAVGYFDLSDINSASDSEIVSSFVSFGTSSRFTNGLAIDGFFDFNRQATVDSAGTNNAFINKTIGILIGNAVDFTSSTRFAAVEFDGIFFADDNTPNSGASGSINDGNSTIHVGTDSGAFDTGAFTSDSITLVTVPEPSSTALLGLGSLALLLRRRR